MDALFSMIQNANGDEIEKVLNAIIRCYSELYPDWEICTITIDKKLSRNHQLDAIIDFINTLRQHS